MKIIEFKQRDFQPSFAETPLGPASRERDLGFGIKEFVIGNCQGLFFLPDHLVSRIPPWIRKMQHDCQWWDGEGAMAIVLAFPELFSISMHYYCTTQVAGLG